MRCDAKWWGQFAGLAFAFVQQASQEMRVADAQRVAEALGRGPFHVEIRIGVNTGHSRKLSRGGHEVRARAQAQNRDERPGRCGQSAFDRFQHVFRLRCETDQDELMHDRCGSQLRLGPFDGPGCGQMPVRRHERCGMLRVAVHVYEQRRCGNRQRRLCRRDTRGPDPRSSKQPAAPDGPSSQ